MELDVLPRLALQPRRVGENVADGHEPGRRVWLRPLPPFGEKLEHRLVDSPDQPLSYRDASERGHYRLRDRKDVRRELGIGAVQVSLEDDMSVTDND